MLLLTHIRVEGIKQEEYHDQGTSSGERRQICENVICNVDDGAVINGGNPTIRQIPASWRKLC
jgi:hypothetical protein